MHGRKRDASSVSPEAAAAAAKKLASYAALQTAALASRHAPRVRASLDASGQLLAANPDVASLWCFRREVLLATLDPAAPAGALEALRVELALTAAGIARNPKSYPAWHHRQWLVGRYHAGVPRCGAPAGTPADSSAPSDTDAPAPLPPLIDLPGELVLCAKLLDADERNFHCWNYRRWVAALMRERELVQGGAGSGSLTRELAFTTECIARNFSNYSALHARSHLLPLAGGGGGVNAAIVAEELLLVRTAAFTEPDDQSAWFYRRWVVGCAATLISACAPPTHDAAPASAASTTEGAAAVRALLQDLDSLAQLQEAEPLCKWPLEAEAHTRALLLRGTVSAGVSSLAAAGAITSEEAAATIRGGRALVASHYARLGTELDLRHARMWAHFAAQVGRDVESSEASQ